MRQPVVTPRSYNAPQPSYNAARPSYNAPRPSYSAPQPSYSAPRGGGAQAHRVAIQAAVVVRTVAVAAVAGRMVEAVVVATPAITARE